MNKPITGHSIRDGAEKEKGEIKNMNAGGNKGYISSSTVAQTVPDTC